MKRPDATRRSDRTGFRFSKDSHANTKVVNSLLGHSPKCQFPLGEVMYSGKIVGQCLFFVLGIPDERALHEWDHWNQYKQRKSGRNRLT